MRRKLVAWNPSKDHTGEFRGWGLADDGTVWILWRRNEVWAWEHQTNIPPLPSDGDGYMYPPGIDMP